MVGHIIIVCGRARVLFTLYVFVCLLGLQVFSFKQHFTVINDVDFNGRENKQKPGNPDIPQNRFRRLNRVQLVTDDNRDSQTLVVISPHGIWLGSEVMVFYINTYRLKSTLYTYLHQTDEFFSCIFFYII